MRSARASSLAPLAALLALAACADLDGLTGGVPDGAISPDVDGAAPPYDAAVGDAAHGRDAPRDGGGMTPDATLPDAPLGDASLPDVPQPSDAPKPVDAPPPPPDAADAGTWCSQQSPVPTFCADFDNGAVTSGWSSINQVGGTLVADTTHYVSAPRSLHATTNATAANGTAQASLNYDPVPTGSNIHLEYQLRTGTLDPSAEVVAGGFAVPTASGNDDQYHIYLVLFAGGAFIEEEQYQSTGDLFQDTGLPSAPTPGQFVRVQFDVVLPKSGGPAPTATVRFDNTVVLSAHPLYGGGASGAIEIEVGASVYPNVPVNACDLDVDDVLLRIAP